MEKSSLKNCVFCCLPAEKIIMENQRALAFYDHYPVNPGHTLVIPRRHVETLFEASLEDVDAMTRLIFQVKNLLQETFNPDGFNVGVNVGRAAGQTVFHLHVHIIPRYHGDVEDPRGGVRKVIRSKAPYPGAGK